MQTETLLYIIISGILALFIALFQYRYKTKNRSQLTMLFTFLRFLTIFTLLLLIVNPKIEQVKVYNEKPNLVIASDNSSSIQHLGKQEELKNVFYSLTSNESLKNKFNIVSYIFDEALKPSDTLSFQGKQTNISKTLVELSKIYKGSNSPTVIISDGNQTYGNDYEFIGRNYNQSIYPIIVGDTAKYADLKIQQLNVNKYAFLKNRFPIELIATYNGNELVNSKLEIKSGNNTVYSQPLVFSRTENSQFINLTLPANRAGVSAFRAELVPIANEKNKVNNIQNFAIEVIDQKTKIAIVSDFLHPDLGAIKKSIESKEQRSVTFLDPKQALENLNNFQLLILYQPTSNFKTVFEELNTQNKNSLVISGPKTDISFLNNIQSYTLDVTNQSEEYQAIINNNYTPFFIEDIDFESFPPLESNFGEVKFSSPYETLLFKSINGNKLESPLLATFEDGPKREAVLFGEGIWKWRSQNYLNTKSFNKFDDFIGKIVQYLASNKRRSRLSVDYESFYNGNNSIIIKAQFFDKSYTFDARERLNITITNIDSQEKRTFPFVLKNNNYQVDLSGIPASKYVFTVSASNENISKAGNFEILEYNVEQQYMNANVTKLVRLATNSQGSHYFAGDDIDEMISELLEDNRYIPVQKSNKNVIPLIDWKYLLALLVLCLSAEWFLRKYNGLI
mgnify:CR=1 FL=1